MPGPPPKPRNQRRRANAPARGEWRTAPGIGWQHGPLPKPPPGLMPASRVAWTTWFKAWFAAYWEPGDMPGLRILVRLHDAVERGEHQRSTELRLWMDGYGVTPAGRQARRWQPPEEPTETKSAKSSRKTRYGHLKVVDVEGGPA